MPQSLPCDTCSLRRVKCDAKNPCGTCLARGQSCTYLKIRKRRGPKGPRKAANTKVQAMQRDLGVVISSMRASSMPRDDPGELSDPVKLFPRRQIPVSTYCTYIDIFRTRLYTVWPIVSTNCLKARLSAVGAVDAEAYALAAAVCAATLAQLRLPAHGDQTTRQPSLVTSADFVRECLQFRATFDYQGSPSVDSLLTSIFLHMYYANMDQITLATFALRDAITFAHILNLGRRQTLDSSQPQERQLRLRIYWILLVTERTFCMQHDLPITLQTIDSLPNPIEDGDSGPALLTGFCNLVRLFTSIDGPLIQAPHSALESPNPTYSRERIREIQEGLKKGATTNPVIEEVQRVDIWITLAWLSSLLWQYSASHFMLSPEQSDAFFSPSFPFSIARDFLSLVCRASIDSVRPHGYGMEIKLFQLANSLVDVLVYVPSLGRTYSTADWGPRHAVVDLEHLLDLVAGGRSERLDKLRDRMSRMHFTPGPRRPLLEDPGYVASAEFTPSQQPVVEENEERKGSGNAEVAPSAEEIEHFDPAYSSPSTGSHHWYIEADEYVASEPRPEFQCYEEPTNDRAQAGADQSTGILFELGLMDGPRSDKLTFDEREERPAGSVPDLETQLLLFPHIPHSVWNHQPTLDPEEMLS